MTTHRNSLVVGQEHLGLELDVFFLSCLPEE